VVGEPSITCVSYDDIRRGSWSCRWGQWVILVREKPSGWVVVVWELPPGAPMTARTQIARATDMPSAQDATTYACDVLRDAGVTLLVSGVPQWLEKFLSFSPAPQEVP
jgi:hypothetical protein